MKWIERKLCACGCGLPVSLRSKSILGHIKREGSQIYNYTDGKNKKLKDWAKSVYERDEYTCQHCFGERGCKLLRAHHIKPKEDFPELIYDVDNGLTLCISCHNTVHNLGSKRSEETKRKLSEQKTGERNPMYGKVSPIRGKITSIEVRKKQSDSRADYFRRINELNKGLTGPR